MKIYTYEENPNYDDSYYFYIIDPDIDIDELRDVLEDDIDITDLVDDEDLNGSKVFTLEVTVEDNEELENILEILDDNEYFHEKSYFKNHGFEFLT